MSESEDTSPASSDSETTFGKFLGHSEQVYANVLNFKFDDAQFYFDKMKSLIPLIAEPERLLANDFLTLAGEYMMGSQRLFVAKTLEDRQAGLAHLSGAKDTLRNLLANNADLANNPGFIQMGLGLGAQILAVQRKLALDRGDSDEAARLEAQAESGLDEIIKSTGPENPIYWFLRGCKSMQEAMPKFAASIRAAGEMNLDLAQQYMRDASESFSTMKSCFGKGGTDAVMTQGSSRLGNGFGLIAQALDSYVNVLRAAIIGDISKTNVEALAEAERNALDGATEITKAARAAPGFVGGLDMQPYANALAVWIRNLRALGERSLSPKEISRSASPRAIIYFLGTFVVLVLALPISGLVQKINFAEIGVLLVVSLIISLIGAFGFESTRLMPWFNVLAGFMPGSRSSAKETPKAEKSQSEPRG